MAYAVYRVIVALIVSALFICVLHEDFLVERLYRGFRRDVMLMHYGYWTFLLLTVDFCLQVQLISA